MENKIRIVICMGSSCYSRGNQVSLELIKAYLSENKSEAKIDFKGQLCSERCSRGPVLIINDVVYQGVQPGNVINILKMALTPKVLVNSNL